MSAKLTVTFTPEDYQPKVEEQLKKQQKKVSIKGFRPGKAPMGMVKKMYGESVLINEINELTNQSINNYLKDNNIEILARPIESQDQQALDFANPTDFTLSFDIGLAPAVSLNISDKDVVKRYKIKLQDSELEDEIKYLTERFGDMTDKDVVEAD
ncbi:MAG: trigger factor family protein, partial [Bacteroidia bacterium]|nr:trigger factor family protein [Bacteroidia bacterium]